MHVHDKAEQDAHPARTPRRAEESGATARAIESGARRPGPPSPAAVPALQRAIGNAAVARMMSGTRDDGDPADAHQHPVQRSAVHEVLSSPGRPLDESTRTEMEARLGADFSDVRVHAGSESRRSAAEIGARAYTSGSHVVIGEGGGDKHTLAHELTHVIQQRRGAVAGTDNGAGLSLSDPGDRFEREAEATAHAVLRGPVPGTSAAGPAEAEAVDHAPHLQAPVQRAPATDQAEEEVAQDPVFTFAEDSDLPPNPTMWSDGMPPFMNFWIGGERPDFEIKVEQFCAYMSVHWLLNGQGTGGLRFTDFAAGTRLHAARTLREWWASGGREGQKQYAAERMGGHEVSLASLDNDARKGTLPVGSTIWFGNDDHAEAAVKTGKDSYLMYDPNSGLTTKRNSTAFRSYIASKNVFVVKPGPGADPESCMCCAVM
ncbi:DUF4157 domain-containing protein [Actinosynnema sp. NPDC049800]